MMHLEQRARDLALLRHAAQTYGKTPGTRVPYAFHLAHVVGVLARLGEDSPWMRAAGWLHDLFEDTDATPADVHMALNVDGIYPLNGAATVIALVQALTRPKDLSRREGNVGYLTQIRLAGPDAVLLKVADRIANVEASIFAGSEILRVYRQEQSQFHLMLHREEDGIERAWAMLRATLGDIP